MSKLTAPAPQHPLRRHAFFKKVYGDCFETKRIERKHPHLFNLFITRKASEIQPIVRLKRKPMIKKELTFWQKVKRFFT
jgi:hypothetical protein